MYHSKEQKEKDKTLAQFHTDFAPMLQVLLHTTIDALRTTNDDDVQSPEQLLSKCQSSTRDLFLVLFEFFGKHIVQTRREIFEKATGLSLSQSAALVFLRQVESDAACAIAPQHDLLGIHVESVRSARPAGQGCFGNR